MQGRHAQLVGQAEGSITRISWLALFDAARC
jgi:hypothetical protein